MHFDDCNIDTILWNAICASNNPADFAIYLRHRPENAAHLTEAESRQHTLGAQTSEELHFLKGIEEIRDLAESGDAKALFHMGKFYSNGNGLVRNLIEAAKWYERAVSKGDIRACHNLALMKFRGEGIERDIDGGLALFEQAAVAGEPDSAEIAADFYCRGKQAPERIRKAITYFQMALEHGSQTAGLKLGQLLYWRAENDQAALEAIERIKSLAEKDVPDATMALGRIYFEGRESNRDIPAARALFEKAIKAGNKEAMISLGLLDINTAPAPHSSQPDLLHWFREAWGNGVTSAAGYIGRCYLEGDGVEKSVEMAIEWYKRGAEAGEAPCCHCLGWLYERGVDVEQDDEEAERWHRKAAVAGLAASQIALGRIYSRDNGVAVDGTEAVKWLTAAANQGDANGMYLLSWLYGSGGGVIRNDNAAFDWCLKAAEAGNLEAQSELARKYCIGLGCEKNETFAFAWAKRAAEAGRAFDQGIMAIDYYFGNNVVQDPDEATKWARLAATQGDANGQWILGECYLLGCAVTKDRAIACDWLRKAADQGHIRAQARLAAVYFAGDEQHENRDFTEAGRWASLAADGGNAMAQTILGHMFLYGEGVEHDAKVAAEWFRLAAGQGDVQAQYRLGRMTAEGIGVKKDWIVALKLLKQAADEGVEAAVGALRSYGVEYLPKSQQQHRLHAEDPLFIDPAFEENLLPGCWVSQSEGATTTYEIFSDGTFVGTAETQELGQMNFSGRWAIRGEVLIWDVWESDFPITPEDNGDDKVLLLSGDELHLKDANGSTLVFRRQERDVQNSRGTETHEVIQFPTTSKLSQPGAG